MVLVCPLCCSLGAKYKHVSDMMIIKAGVRMTVRCQEVRVKVTDRWWISASTCPSGFINGFTCFHMNKIWMYGSICYHGTGDAHLVACASSG